MCNAYTVRPKVGAKALNAVVSAEIACLPSPLVRRSGRGVVVTSTGDSLSAQTMRWGFHRPFSDSINNARSDKITSSTWADAVEKRRCLVPVNTFYEWQHLDHRVKQAYEFRRPDGEWMWIAGLYEDCLKYGHCYATITTEPAPVVVSIHDRMLAVLEFEEALAFLRGEMLRFEPYQGELVASACESPLKQKPETPGGGSQRELF